MRKRNKTRRREREKGRNDKKRVEIEEKSDREGKFFQI